MRATAEIIQSDPNARFSGVSSLPTGFNLLGDRDRGVGTIWHHVDVVRLHDQLGLRVGFLCGHHFSEFGIIVGRVEATVAFLFRWITANINEGIFRADAKLGIALLRNPIPAQIPIRPRRR